MKDCPIFKVLITKTGHRPTQFKKITDTLPLLCLDKNFHGLDEVLWIGTNLVKVDFMSPYPNATRWLSTHNVKIQTVAKTAAIDTTTGVRPFVHIVIEQTDIFDTNLQKQLL